MRQDDVKVRHKGDEVDCQIMCKTWDHAARALKHVEDNPPLGYILLMGKIRRRARGGRARFLTMCFRHTGNVEHPPMTDWEDWNATLQEEQQIAVDVTAHGRAYAQTDQNDEDASRGTVCPKD
jgi:hypothetical protein